MSKIWRIGEKVVENELFEPLQTFENELEKKHEKLTEEYFEELVEKSGVNIEENAATLQKRNKILEELKDTNKYLKKYRRIRTLVIVSIILLALVGAVCGLYFSGNNDLFFLCILIPSICLCGIIGLIVVICVKINKKINSGSLLADRLNAEAEQLKQDAWNQMCELNVKFDWNTPAELVAKTLPLIKIDKYFDQKKFKYFAENFNLCGDLDDTRSIYCVKSGSSNGNPFLQVRYFNQSFTEQRYDGYLTVEWTEELPGLNGSTTYVKRSEKLCASVYKPKPTYDFLTVLYYANDAAPDLRFSRSPVVPAGADENKIQSIIKSGEKKLEKKVRTAVKTGEQFNKLANSEFEVLFGADDRNNEMQFRLIFTPLAQQNEVKLIRKSSYGDDFSFIKNGKINLIHSLHGGLLDIDCNPEFFTGYDFTAIKNKFINFNKVYFKSIYFDFAPLFAIPAYMQDKPKEEYGECDRRGQIGEWELESLANFFDSDLVSAPDTATDTIVKARAVQNTENGCVTEVTGHSFRAVQMVDYVSVKCKNGNYYNVAVPWIDYIPIHTVTTMQVEAADITREDFIKSQEGSNRKIFVNGLKANLL